MGEFVKLNAAGLEPLHEVNPRLMSYNIEFAEVTGGTFWKAYTPGQVAGTEPFQRTAWPIWSSTTPKRIPPQWNCPKLPSGTHWQARTATSAPP